MLDSSTKPKMSEGPEEKTGGTAGATVNAAKNP
jgi:hypothetical protein